MRKTSVQQTLNETMAKAINDQAERLDFLERNERRLLDLLTEQNEKLEALRDQLDEARKATQPPVVLYNFSQN